MQKPKNLLPGLFLCVFSRIAEPLVDFIAVIFEIFPFFIWGRLFLPERKVFPALFIQAHFIQAHFARRFHKNPTAPPRKAPTQKTPGASSTPERAFGNTHPKGPPRTPHLYSAALFGMPPRPKGPNTKVPEGSGAPKGPHAKTPGVSPGVLVDEKFI